MAKKTKRLFQEPEDIFVTYRTGYRTWGIYKNKKDGGFVLFSDAGGVIWPKREKLAAKCLKAHLRAHASPYPTCQCGIHAMNRIEDIKNPAEYIRHKAFAGRVKLWGTVMEHTEGVRAEFAYPASIICARCSKCDEFKKLDELTFFSFYSTSSISSIRGFCKKCEILIPGLRYSEKIDKSFLSQIAEEYGIEVGEGRC